jgi:hypothetical protein
MQWSEPIHLSPGDGVAASTLFVVNYLLKTIDGTEKLMDFCGGQRQIRNKKAETMCFS